MIGLIRSEALRTRSRRLLWITLWVGAVAIVVGVAVGTLQSTNAGSASNAMRLSDLEGLIEGLALILVLTGVLLGASYGGAEWGSGSVGTLLTWEPRRVRVLLVRGVFVGGAVFLAVLALEVWLVLLFRAGVALRGTTSGAEGWFGDVSVMSLRIAGLSALFSLIAYGAAMIGRSSVFGTAAMFVYLVAIEGVLAAHEQWLRRWLLIRAATAAISGTTSYEFQPGVGQVIQFTPGRGWFVVGVYVVGVLALAAAAFRTRDVT